MRVQKSAPGPFSPFSFDEATAISDSSENDRSLILEIYTLTKGGLIKSIDDVKALAKTAGTVPQDFHSFNFQLKVFTIAVVFVFGKDSILATKIRDFVENADGKHSIIYKKKIAIKDTFVAKVLWSVDCSTQLFLEDCRKCHDREDVNQRVIDFNGLNMDILLYHFNAILPPLFHNFNNKSDENNDPKSEQENGSARGTPTATKTKKSKKTARKIV